MKSNVLRVDIVSAVPQLLESGISHSIVGRARKKGIVDIIVHNLHEYSENKFRHIDAPPYGGGAGMILQCAPVFACIERLIGEREYDHIIYLTPDGEVFNQNSANELSLSRNIILIAGHYKGIDQRIRDVLTTKEISIGDYVLSGGELPALVIVDALTRLVPGVLGDAESALEDSFMNGLLESPQYTRPAEFRGMEVPAELRSGNHAQVRKWRETKALEKTKERRPDLFELYQKDNEV